MRGTALLMLSILFTVKVEHNFKQSCRNAFWSLTSLCHLAGIFITEVILKQKREESFPMLWVGDEFALVEFVAEESRKGLVEEDIRHH